MVAVQKNENGEERIQPLMEAETDKLLQKEKFRVRTKEVVDECLDTVSFMRKVQEYASEEIDKRLYKSLKFWLSIIATAILTTLGSMLVNYIINRA